MFRRLALLLPAVMAVVILWAPSAQARTVRAFSSTRSVTLARGDTLVYRLPESPSTGYLLKTIHRPSLLRLISSTYHQTPEPAGNVGGGGFRSFTYVAAGRGTGTLQLIAARDKELATRFSLKITVR